MAAGVGIGLAMAPVNAALLVPFYAIFGVSVFAARLAVVSFFVLSLALLAAMSGRPSWRHFK